MALARVRSFAVHGIDARPVEVEVHVGGGLPSVSIVGLPHSAVREARDRLRAALTHLGFGFPQVRVTVNLSPADLPKRGGGFDLPIALAVLVATGSLPARAVEGVDAFGELGLGGELRGAPGALPASLAAARQGRTLVLARANLAEAALAPGARLVGADTLDELHAALRERVGRTARRSPPGSPCASGGSGAPAPAGPAAAVPASDPDPGGPDLADVVGQLAARRAVEIAAAGGHALLLHGPPGVGKSMLARRLVGLRPPLPPDEALEVATLASVSGAGFDAARWGRRPYRAPHHSASAVALVGGGSPPMPGEISLAHAGVLFLDELPEFQRRTLEALRAPLESGTVTVSRGPRQADFPAAFQLVAAMNPCPCGHAAPAAPAEGAGATSGGPSPGPSAARAARRCRCSADEIARYLGRLSGPFLERIDLGVHMRREPPPRADAPAPESSARTRMRTRAAAALARERQGVENAALDAAGLARHAPLGPEARSLLDRAAERGGLSMRARVRTHRVARTIADLGGADAVGIDHLAEALSWRPEAGALSANGD